MTTPENDRRKKTMPLDKDTAKAAVKEALREWLDEKYSTFGKWSIHGLLAMALAGAVYIFMISNGWHK
jgi:hypothetical protein